MEICKHNKSVFFPPIAIVKYLSAHHWPLSLLTCYRGQILGRGKNNLILKDYGKKGNKIEQMPDTGFCFSS